MLCIYVWDFFSVSFVFLRTSGQENATVILTSFFFCVKQQRSITIVKDQSEVVVFRFTIRQVLSGRSRQKFSTGVFHIVQREISNMHAW